MAPEVKTPLDLRTERSDRLVGRLYLSGTDVLLEMKDRGELATFDLMRLLRNHYGYDVEIVVRVLPALE